MQLAKHALCSRFIDKAFTSIRKIRNGIRNIRKGFAINSANSLSSRKVLKKFARIPRYFHFSVLLIIFSAFAANLKFSYSQGYSSLGERGIRE